MSRRSRAEVSRRPQLQKDPFKTGKDSLRRSASAGSPVRLTQPAAETDAATTGELAATPPAKTADVGAADVAPAARRAAANPPTPERRARGRPNGRPAHRCPSLPVACRSCST